MIVLDTTGGTDKQYQCPESHPEYVAWEVWPGTKGMCDCLEREGNRDYYLNKLCSRKSEHRAYEQTWGSLKEIEIGSNTNAQEDENCFNVAGTPPQIMNRFDGLVICGKRGGYSFKDMIRPTVLINGKN